MEDGDSPFQKKKGRWRLEDSVRGTLEVQRKANCKNSETVAKGKTNIF